MAEKNYRVRHSPIRRFDTVAEVGDVINPTEAELRAFGDNLAETDQPVTVETPDDVDPDDDVDATADEDVQPVAVNDTSVENEMAQSQADAQSDVEARDVDDEAQPQTDDSTASTQQFESAEAFVDRTPMDEVVSDIQSGDYDDRLDAIEQAENENRDREGVQDAIDARREA